MKFSALYAIIIGVGMIGQWLISYVNKKIPELETEPYRIWFHIAGELITAALLIASGIGLLAAAPWASALFLVAMGMLIYTAIVSPGYFAQRGEWIWVYIFAVIVLLAIVSVVAVAGVISG